MRNAFLLILTIVVLTACQKDENMSKEILDGTYTGSFQRIVYSENSESSEVTLTFTANRWNGTSTINKYPALCGGTYLIEGDSIIFGNDCYWTAEFDWSLILQGAYKISMINDQLEFYRDYYIEDVNHHKDRYFLNRTF